MGRTATIPGINGLPMSFLLQPWQLLLFVKHLGYTTVSTFADLHDKPHTARMKQAARELMNVENRFPNSKRGCAIDRDGQLCGSFRAMLEDEGVKSAQLPPRSPHLNPHLALLAPWISVPTFREECR